MPQDVPNSKANHLYTVLAAHVYSKTVHLHRCPYNWTLKVAFLQNFYTNLISLAFKHEVVCSKLRWVKIYTKYICLLIWYCVFHIDGQKFTTKLSKIMELMPEYPKTE